MLDEDVEGCKREARNCRERKAILDLSAAMKKSGLTVTEIRADGHQNS
jgi:hypothetical protein